MTSSDYDHLLIVFERYFGEVVDLITSNKHILKLFEPSGKDLLKKSLKIF